eukprot:scaffold920_cov63-Phaeocystis_antarctica.AAC.4
MARRGCRASARTAERAESTFGLRGLLGTPSEGVVTPPAPPPPPTPRHWRSSTPPAYVAVAVDSSSH